MTARLTSKRVMIFLVARAGLVLLYEWPVPREYKLPYVWDIPVLVALAWSSILLLVWPPLWKQLRFWIALGAGITVQVWTMEEWLRGGFSTWGTGRNSGFLGILVWAVCYWLLWRISDSQPSPPDDTST